MLMRGDIFAASRGCVQKFLTMHVVVELTMTFCCRKGSLGYGSPEQVPGTRRSGVDGKVHCDPTCGIGWKDLGIGKP